MPNPIKHLVPNALRKLYHSGGHVFHKLRAQLRPIRGRKTLYLHIGHGKTGTTALQEFFWENRKRLAQCGIDYPAYCVIAGAHHALSPHQPEFLHGIPFKKVEEWAPIIARGAAHRKILLSSELIAWSSPEVIYRYCTELKKYFDLKIVLYLRRQDELIMAAYNQQVKAGRQQQPILDVLEKNITRIDFQERIQAWENCAGGGNVILRPFEKRQFHRDDIRLDFLHHVFGMTEFEGFTLDSNNSNPRLSPVALEYKRLLNRLFDDARLSNRYNEVLLAYSTETDKDSTRIHGKVTLLSPQDRLRILKRFEEHNARLGEIYLPGKKLFLTDPPDADEPWTPLAPDKTELRSISSYIQQRNRALHAELMDSIGKLPAELRDIFTQQG
jgi:hypothetical protein